MQPRSGTQEGGARRQKAVKNRGQRRGQGAGVPGAGGSTAKAASGGSDAVDRMDPNQIEFEDMEEMHHTGEPSPGEYGEDGVYRPQGASGEKAGSGGAKASASKSKSRSK